MAAAPIARPTGLPSSPRSPTLSERSFDSSMILPGDAIRAISPPLFGERPPSPSSFYAHANRSTHTLTLATAPPRRSPQLRNSPPLSSQSSRSTLRNMNPSQADAKSPALTVDTIASSPTVQDGLLGPEPSDYISHSPSQRRLSTTSSLNSEDLEMIRNRWPGFDSQGFDDSGVDLDEGDNQGQFPMATPESEVGDDRWQNGDFQAKENAYSSDLYAKRAEMILADAKKRLNVMENNIRGARQSLVVSPTFNSSKMATEFQHQINAARERDRKLYAGIGPIPPRNRLYQSSPLSATGSPTHSRGMSETSVPLPFSSPSYMAKLQDSKRASSAMGHGSGPWSPQSYGNGRFPIRESRSFEVMRDPRGQDESLRTHSRGSRSPSNVLETLPEDESPRVHRSASTTSSLRDQVHDLKHRISSLRLKTQEDSMRRRSQQSLRAPSPFTSAETWYSGTEAYKTPGSPISADAGVGFKLESPSRKVLYEDEAGDSTSKQSVAAAQQDHAYAVKEVAPEYEQSPPDADEAEGSFHYDDWEQQKASKANVGLGLGLDETDEDDFISVNGDDIDTGSSVYEDAVYEMPATERHEDRIDAFDYENFFLHSAMGTYSAARPRSSSSSSSTDSVATTRPVNDRSSVATILHTRNVSSGSAKRVSMHIRNSSQASVSTVASFATAAEDLSDDDEENPQMDQFSKSLFPSQQPVVQDTAALPRSDSAYNVSKPASSSSPATSSTSTLSRVSSPSSGDLVTGLQTSKIFSILSQTPRDEPQLALNEEEKQLIYSLAASLQQVCSNLRSTTNDQYVRKEWRRRLDEARRVLNGEELEGQPF
ncbi:hypothetical protein DPSP01_002004 [Paraphaeosphaeria sporulosa]|uniref:Uncharacterized protein n=1 Tax=Paraphaeosphaeria sporulosa TaxID=1460663 RepID=A0A177CZZ3_9PLEO|nr:uncharacterized protein CC84DRAFT_1159837 [Paraphaeosphaeria sporulosa]OAG12547.1 hypothetical protein CC84DRAFT_1159837 [Paraphaeosphaeria sporulosa]